MKFSNFLSKLRHVLLISFMFIFTVLPFPAVIIMLLVFNIDVANALLVPLLLGFYPIMLNWFLGFACGATFYNTGYVRKGRTVSDIVRDDPYYKRAIYVNFITMSLFILLAIYFIFTSFNLFSGWSIASIIEAIIGAVLYFLLAMSAIEKSGMSKKEKKEFAEEFKNKEPIKKEKVVVTKFNFSNYSELKELYLSYKQAKNGAIHLKNDPKHLEEYNEICLKRDDMFEQLSKAIYDEFNEKKPDLINKKTNEKVAWNDLFSAPFEKLTKKQKDYMVRLLDAQPYKFKDDSLYNY